MLFLVQMKGCTAFAPNEAADPAFAAALRQAREAGVEILCRDCIVTEGGMTADRDIRIIL